MADDWPDDPDYGVDHDPRDEIDEQALLPVEYRDSRFTGHVELETGAFAIGFMLRSTVKVMPGVPTELRVVVSEVDALALSRAILDVLQGLAHDRIMGDECHWCGRTDSIEGVIVDDNGDRFPYCHRHEDEVRSMIDDTLEET